MFDPRAGRSSLNPLAAAVAAVVGSSCIALPALAQDTDVRGGRAPLDEMVVTASRRETTVQETPLNVQALSGEMLESERLSNLTELSRFIPGLTVVDQGPRASDLMTVRGLNVTSLNASEFLDNSSGGTVQTYLGDVPVYLDLKLRDVDRVEVLLGPQGTLYGASTLAGAVRYIPRAPDTHDFSIDAKGNLYGVAHSDGTGYETDLAVNVPIVRDKLAFRASLLRLDDPGFIDYPYLVRDPGVSNPQPNLGDPADVAANLRRENDADWEHTVSGRLSLLWNATDAVKVTFDYYYQDQDVGARTVDHRDAFGTSKYESADRFLEPNDRQTDLFSVDVVADLGFAELTSATGVSNYDQLGQRDQTDLLLGFGDPYDLFPSFAAYTREIATERRVNEEVRLVSKGAGPWSWIGGLFYNDYKDDASSEEFTPHLPEFFGVSFATGDLEYRQLTRDTLTEKAVFGEVGYAFAPAWSVTLGGRFFEYDTHQYLSFDIPFADVIGDANENEADDDGFLGKVNFAYRYADDSLAYLTVSQGYRIGGVNMVPPCADPLPAGQNVCALPDEVLVKPDRTTNYELGMKTAWLDGRFNFDADVFNVDWEDIQTLGETQNGAIPITVNGGSARSRGVELALSAETEGPWSFRATYAYTQAELTSFAPGLVDGEDAFAGDRLAGTPEQQGSFLATYSRPLRNGMRLRASYGLTATSDVLTKVGLRANGETLGGYTIHSASIGVGREQWTANLYADNLTDKFAETGVRVDPSYIENINGFDSRRYFRDVLRPRSIGIEFRYRLGE
ncbi:MAG TPA: TonB-dependent receptor [Gammaproteobacteria bacterium]|nr:TonB-dependent receptor [Gammaproteobacteria bacterium]